MAAARIRTPRPTSLPSPPSDGGEGRVRGVFLFASKMRLQLGSGKELEDQLFDSILLFRPKEPSVDAALDPIEQLEPVLQEGLGQRLPAVVALFAREKTPLLADPMSVDLAFAAVGCLTLPTDFASSHNSVRQFNARDGHGSDAFFTTEEAEVLVGRGLNANVFNV